VNTRGEQLEVERTYDVPEGFTLPDLQSLPGVAAADEPVSLSLEAVYVDTADLRLLSARTTLRRRTGGQDDGWHLKLPAPGGDRLEVHRPAGRAGTTPPISLRRLVTARAAGAALVPVATLRTMRTVRVLRGADGGALAEVCVDAVSATKPSDVAPRMWTELEVELVAQDRDLQDAVEGRLLEAGAEAAQVQSKLRRALGDPPATPSYDTETAGGVVLTALARLVETLAEWDVALRRDQPRSVHQMRVTMRRLRSMLAVSRRLLDREVTEPVREGLAGVAAALGVVRDDEVLRGNLTALFEEADASGIAAGRRRVLTVLANEERAHRAAMQKAIDSESYVALWASLRALLLDPPFTDAAARSPRKELGKAVRKTWERLDGHRDELAAMGPGRESDETVHELRKSAKRLRYAVDEAGSVLSSSASEEMAHRLKRFQEHAGSLRDDQLALLRVAELAERLPSDAFVLGHLHGLLTARVAGRLESLDAEAERLASPKERKRLTR
jgi:CHAD domain-containing protein